MALHVFSDRWDRLCADAGGGMGAGGAGQIVTCVLELPPPPQGWGWDSVPIVVAVRELTPEVRTAEDALVAIAEPGAWATARFVAHYGLAGFIPSAESKEGQHNSSGIKLRPVRCLPLAHVTFGIDDETRARDLIRIVGIAARTAPFLVRAGDPLTVCVSDLASSAVCERATVQSSEPLSLGLFTSNTTFSIVHTPSSPARTSTGASAEPLPLFSPFLKKLQATCDITGLAGRMPQYLEARLAASLPGSVPFTPLDAGSSIGLCLSDLLRHNLQHGSWVTVHSSKRRTTRPLDKHLPRKHLAQIVHVHPAPHLDPRTSRLLGEEEEEVVFLLGSRLFAALQEPLLPATILDIQMERCAAPPHIAAVVQVAQVYTPDHDRSVHCNIALRSHFSRDRVVIPGDIFSLQSDLRGEVDGQRIVDGGATAHSESRQTIFFTVASVACATCDKDAIEAASHGEAARGISLPSNFKSECRSPGLIVNTTHATLYHCGVRNSAAPSLQKDMSSGPLSAPGLDAETARLADLVRVVISSQAAPKGPHLSNLLLLHGPRGAGKRRVVETVASTFGLHVLEARCSQLASDIAGRAEAKLEEHIKRAKRCTPCILLLRDIDKLAPPQQHNEHGLPSQETKLASILQDLVAAGKQSTPDLAGSGDHLLTALSGAFLVIGTTSQDTSTFTSPLLNVFQQDLRIDTLDEARRLTALQHICRRESQELIITPYSVDFASLARETAGLLVSDLEALVSRAVRNATHRLRLSFEGLCPPVGSVDESLLASGPVHVTGDDFSAALKELHGAQSESESKPRIPNVQWQDVGGLAHAKQEILDTVQLPLQHPELFSAGLRRSGVLLYGPPGTGKTLLAKAVATECSLNFFSVKGPELINPYVGQSEANVREVFARARAARPCVIFFDELDSLAPNRGNAGDSGGVMDRVVSQLLAEVDGLNASSDVFVIGATNRPDLLDPALLRPGRFDRLVFLGVDASHTGKQSIFRALTRKFLFEDSFDSAPVLERCPPNMTGADYYALCSDAMLRAIQRIVASDPEAAAQPEVLVRVSTSDFLDALSALAPSVSMQDLERYSQLQTRFSTKKEPISTEDQEEEVAPVDSGGGHAATNHGFALEDLAEAFALRAAIAESLKTPQPRSESLTAPTTETALSHTVTLNPVDQHKSELEKSSTDHQTLSHNSKAKKKKKQGGS